MNLYIHDLAVSGKSFLGAALLWGVSSAPGANAQLNSISFYADTPPAVSCAEGVQETDHASPALLRTCRAALKDNGLGRTTRAATMVNTGILEGRADNYEEALRLFELAQASDADLPDIRINVAAVQIRAGQPDAALETLDDIETIAASQQHIAYFNRGLAYWHLEQFEAAYRDFSDARALKSDYQPASSMLSKFSFTSSPQSASKAPDSAG